MRTYMRGFLIAGLAWTITTASTAVADDGADDPIPAARQVKLLERFGDDGIDANGDGSLTHEEVRTFLEENFGDERTPRCQRAERGPRGKGHRGMRGKHMGAGKGPGEQLGGLLKRLELLASDTPPAEFDLERFPGADADGDGVLSNDEWKAFAAKARERMLTGLARRMPEADTDGNGVIDDAELAAIKDEMRARVLERHPEADTDGDGTLSDAELDALHAEQLEKRAARILELNPEADLDGDGVLSKEEARQARKDRPRDGHGRKPREGRGKHHPGDGYGEE